MNNKITTVVASTILTLTVGSLPSYALNSSKYSVANFDTDLTTVDLNNGSNQTSNPTSNPTETTKQVKDETGKFLTTRRRRVCRTRTRTIRRGGRTRTVRRWWCW